MKVACALIVSPSSTSAGRGTRVYYKFRED
jgi:hypothetical protein